MTVRVRVPIAKLEQPAGEPLRAFGWASISADSDGNPIVDHQGDVIAPAELEAAAYEFARTAGPANVNHDGPDVGRLIESVVYTPEKRKAMGLPPGPVAWWVGFEVSDAAAANRVRAGELKELSIEGSAERVPL